ncbi:MAG: hypothetical protein AB1832_18935 [Pseudomonadota bacterium]
MTQRKSKDYEDFVRNALRWGDLQEQGQYRAGNRYATEIEKLGRKLREDEEGQKILVELIQHVSPYVQIWAAKDCLAFAPQLAESKLQALEDSIGSFATDAREVLAEWRKGTLFRSDQ